MFLYARIYWLAEFGDVYSLTIWECRLSLPPGRILSDNFVGRFCQTILRVKSDKTLCSTWEYDRWYTWRDQYFKPILSKLTIDPEIFSLNCFTVIWNKKWCLINPMGTKCAPFSPTCSFIHTRNTSYRGFWRKTTRS